MADYGSVFHLISAICKKTKISCVLIGGFAVNYYKVTRQTVDVDFLIVKEDYQKIIDLLEKAGYRQDFSQEIFARLKNKQLHLLDIDFLFVDRETMDKIIKDAEKVDITGRQFLVPCLNHLIALKLHTIKYNPKTREHKDLPDIINLLKINKVDFKNKSFKELCLKYGTEKLYQQILDSM